MCFYYILYKWYQILREYIVSKTPSNYTDEFIGRIMMNSC